MRGVIVLVAFVAAPAACLFSSDEDGDPKNSVALDQIETAYKEAYCTYLARCGLFPDQATCVSAKLPQRFPSYRLSDQVMASIRAGRIGYNGSNVKACFDAIAATSCDRTDMTGRAPVVACQQFISGLIGAGADCYADLECKSRSCAGNSDPPGCTPGTCVGDVPPVDEPGQLGAPCESGCAQGLYCDQATFTCAMLRTAGMSCFGTETCAYGLGCAGSPSTCRVLPGVGEPCPDGLCRDEGTYCDYTATTPVCAAFGLPGASCQQQQCSEYYVCDQTTLQCAEPPAVGESCATIMMCFAADAYCDLATSTCMVAQPDGAPCDSSLECISGACTGFMCGDPQETCP